MTERGASLDPPVFRRKLMAWYRRHARVLPWRGCGDPYRIWLSEVMLQQTRVAAVIEHYHRFLACFPTLEALAHAPGEDVLAAWSGLGYYRRARMLHQGAKFVLEQLGGQIPETAAELRKLPGIGDYTAAAIASIAFGESIAVVDGNVERVLLRLTGRSEDPTSAGRNFVRQQAGALVPFREAGDHNQAMMELGATICLPRTPLCLNCPVYDLCLTRGEHPTPPRAKPQRRPAAYLLHLRGDELLLQRRPAEASLMAGMIELPPLAMDAVAGRKPLLRLRHAITTTLYAVEVHAAPDNELSTPDVEWITIDRLPHLPLTGLARKILLRFGILPPV